MLKSFRVSNFRCLDDTELDNLARVNLVVGDNDTGKTALLEAFFAHLIQGNAGKFVTLRAFRREFGAADESFWLDFFTGFDGSKEIRLSSVDHAGIERHSKITLGESAEITTIAPPASGATVDTTAKPPVSPAFFRPLLVEYKQTGMGRPFVNELRFDAETRKFSQAHSFESKVRAYYFSTGGPPQAQNVANDLSQLLVRKQEALLLALAKTIDNRIQNLSVASPYGRSEVFVDVGEPNLIPLNLLGSGVFRAIGIASAIPVYEGGLLLVDEIENGIYYKRLGDFWMGILELARRYNVQVVATTHSQECIKYAIETIRPDLTDTDPLHIYRLVPGQRKPTHYMGESVRSVEEFMAEVR